MTEREKKEKRLFENLKSHTAGKRKIISYRADRFEPDIYHLEKIFPEIQFYYPRVIQEENRLEFAASEGWTKDRFGLWSPTGRIVLNPEEADLIIVPSLGFNEKGIRLGRGGGFYDRTLEFSVLERTLGLGFKELFPINFTAEPYDIAVNAIVFDD